MDSQSRKPGVIPEYRAQVVKFWNGFIYASCLSCWHKQGLDPHRGMQFWLYFSKLFVVLKACKFNLTLRKNREHYNAWLEIVRVSYNNYPEVTRSSSHSAKSWQLKSDLSSENECLAIRKGAFWISRPVYLLIKVLKMRLRSWQLSSCNDSY
jgi:hypothetical protein